jgi:type IV pilus assembly protein PilW
MRKAKHINAFTLVELLVAMVVGMLLVASMYVLFRSSSEVYVSQEQMVDVRQDIRATLAMMTRDLRMAGLDPSRNATCSGVTSANATSLRFQYDYDGDGVCERDFDYFYDAGNTVLKMQLSGSGGYQPVVYDISSVQFSYVLSDNTMPTIPADPNDVRVVNIRVCGKISGPYSEKYNTPRCFNSTVRCRNMGLE